MAGMERFTQRARRVLSLAHQEAERSRSNFIGTEHLLIGLMEEEGGVAGRVLRELSMKKEQIREVVSRISTPSPDFDPSRVELAAETQEVLENSVDEARRLGHHYIGTEHLLLGLVRVEDAALEVLRRLGVTADQIRRQTRRVLNESYSSPPKSSSTAQNPDQQYNELRDSILSTRLAQSKDKPRVFIVHGHDNEAKETVARYVENLGLKVVILNRPLA